MDYFLIVSTIIISSASIFVTQKIFHKRKIFDKVNHRSSHSAVATRSGGISIFSTLFLISVFFYFSGIELFDYSLFIPLGIIFFLGVYDDLYIVDYKIKFFMQIIISKILIDQGFVITSFYGVFGIFEIPWLLAQIITVIFFVTLLNAYNFIDGVDGLAISESIKNLLFFIYIFPSDDKLYFLCQLILIIIIPLYHFNFRKQNKVFLGDAGSLLLGGINMIMVLHMLNPFTTLTMESSNKVLIVIAVILYPLIDLFRVIVIRTKSNHSLFLADKNHIHHWLANKGFSHFMITILICFSGGIILFSLAFI